MSENVPETVDKTPAETYYPEPGERTGTDANNIGPNAKSGLEKDDLSGDLQDGGTGGTVAEQEPKHQQAEQPEQQEQPE